MLPKAVAETVAQVEDERDRARTLSVMFDYQCMGKIPDLRSERPVVRLTLMLCTKQMEAWERRAAQYRDSKRAAASASADAEATPLWNDCGNPQQREKEREEGKAKEKASPTPPYKEKGEREKRAENRETREAVEFHNTSTARMFEEFWSEYPRKVSRKAAARAFRTAVGDGRLCDTRRDSEFKDIMRGLRAHKRSSQWNRDGGQYIPHPSTWLNQERWRDEVDCDPSVKSSDSEARMAHADEVASRILKRRAS